MGLDFNKLSPEELLVAESAVMTIRSLQAAGKAAPHGKGLVCVEQALHETGFDHLRTILTTALASHEAAQKKGSPANPAPAARRRHSGGAPKRRS